jgi:hypothetical protein
VLAAALVYAVLAVAMVGQGLAPGRTLSSSDRLWDMTPWTAEKPAGVRHLGSNYELADAVAVFQPMFQYTREQLPSIPLWNPHLMGGRPYMANAQSAIFSPFGVPAYVLPFWKSLAVIAMLKLFVAAFGMFLLSRVLGMRFGGALLSGVVFAFGTFFVVWLPWPLTNIFPLIPFILLLTELVIRRPGPLPAAGLAGVVALQFLGGHPETSFHVMVVTLCWFAFRAGLAWWRGGRERSTLVAPAAWFTGALVLGTALSALAILPLLEFLAHSGDVERRLDAQPSFSDRNYLGAFFLSDYWGRPTQTALVPFVSNRGYYAGGITLMLAAVALVVRPTATRVAIAVFGVLTLAVVVGQAPVATVVFELPGFSTAHNGRMVIFILLGLALLAGWGLDELTERAGAVPRRAAALAVAAAIFLFPVAWLLVAGTIDLGKLGTAARVAWAFQDPPVPDASLAAIQSAAAPVVRLSSLLIWLPLAGAGLLIVAAGLGYGPRRRVAVPLLVGLAVTVLAADLFRANMGFNPAIPIENARQPATPAIQELQSRAPNRFAAVNLPGEIQPLEPDLAMRYGLYDARGYDYPVEKRYDKLWRATAGPQGDVIPPTVLALPTEASLRTLSLLSVSDLLQPPTGPELDLPGLELAYSGPDARVYRNSAALPRAFLVERQRLVPGADAALAAVSSPAFRPRVEAITERRIPGLADASQGAAGAAPGAARLASYGPERVEVRSRARRPSLLVLTDVHYPGWKATVDGRDVPVERVNYLLRGVRVPAGVHTVEFAYRPASWRIGWIVSALGLVVLIALVVTGLRRRGTRAA